jgi:type II secretory pathway pseudopilin PulG
MKPWLFAVAAIIAIAAIAGPTLFILQNRAQHQRELDAARATYDRLEGLRRQIVAISRSEMADHNKIDKGSVRGIKSWTGAT